MATSTDVLPVVERADQVPGPGQGCWDYESYAAIPDDGKRYEVIDGILYMSPAPNIPHQAAVIQFGTRLMILVQDAGLGRVFVAPVDVELVPGGRGVVQPDVLVILNAKLDSITHSHIVGAPDLVIEVASPSTASHDRRAKMDAYAQAGVREYWIADPYAQTVEPLVLLAGEFRSLGVFQGEATLPSRVVPELPVQVRQFFT